MSHRATAWALSAGLGRGLNGDQRWVLWYLCDCYNPDMGCFPRQETIAEHCEISIASVNRHLKKLAEVGLIYRVVRKDERTGRQLRTQYILAFEEQFPGKRLPLINLRGGNPEARELPTDPDSQSDNRSDSQSDQKPALNLRDIEQSSINPVNEPCNARDLSIDEAKDALRAELEPADWLAYVQVLEAIKTDAEIRILAPNEFVIGWLIRNGKDERIRTLIAQSGESRPVLIVKGSTSAPAYTGEKPRTVAAA